MPALNRALALAERDDVAVIVGHDLHFDVAGVIKIGLAENRSVGERVGRLAPGRLHRVRQ